MKANWKSLLFLITVVIVGALFFTFLGGQKKDQQSLNNKNKEGVVAGATTVESGYDVELAKDLRDKGMVLYGSYQSDDSEQQLAIFGDAAKYLDYVECDASGPSANPDECISQKVEIYPTWIYQGKSYTGEKSLGELANIVGFSE